MSFRSWGKWSARAPGALTLSLAFVFSSSLVAFANVSLVKLSSDP